jgi:hypothetical protein
VLGKEFSSLFNILFVVVVVVVVSWQVMGGVGTNQVPLLFFFSLKNVENFKKKILFQRPHFVKEKPENAFQYLGLHFLFIFSMWSLQS